MAATTQVSPALKHYYSGFLRSLTHRLIRPTRQSTNRPLTRSLARPPRLVACLASWLSSAQLSSAFIHSVRQTFSQFVSQSVSHFVSQPVKKGCVRLLPPWSKRCKKSDHTAHNYLLHCYLADSTATTSSHQVTLSSGPKVQSKPRRSHQFELEGLHKFLAEFPIGRDTFVSKIAHRKLCGRLKLVFILQSRPIVFVRAISSEATTAIDSWAPSLSALSRQLEESIRASSFSLEESVSF